MSYDRLVLAPGGTPRALDVDGMNLRGVHTLRAIDDSDAIQASAKDARHAVVVGGSFIGMECASSLRQISEKVGTDPSITIVAPEAVPFAPVLGKKVGEMLQELHEENGITFRLKEHVAALHGAGSRPGGEERVQQIELESGDSLPADLVLVGIGVEPATGFVEGVEKADDGGVVVDEQLRAQLPEAPTRAARFTPPATPPSFPTGSPRTRPRASSTGAWPASTGAWRAATPPGRARRTARSPTSGRPSTA
jgi:NAD(P)H-nitrite reductase large subunit